MIATSKTTTPNVGPTYTGSGKIGYDTLTYVSITASRED